MDITTATALPLHTVSLCGILHFFSISMPSASLSDRYSLRHYVLPTLPPTIADQRHVKSTK